MILCWSETNDSEVSMLSSEISGFEPFSFGFELPVSAVGTRTFDEHFFNNALAFSIFLKIKIIFVVFMVCRKEPFQSYYVFVIGKILNLVLVK